MRILVALGEDALLQNEGAVPVLDRHPGAERAASVLAELAGMHEAVVFHCCGREAGQVFELALRNRLPGQDVVSVLTQVVVSGKEPEPNAIAEIRSLRLLVGSGALVICAADGAFPVALQGDGTMHRANAALDGDLTAALLARRLDADLLLMLTGAERQWAGEPKIEAACSFAASTGRRAAIGALTDLVRVARGEAGTQVLAPGGGAAIAAARRLPER